MAHLAERATAAFGAALLPPEHGGPTAELLVQRVERYLSQLPRSARVAIRAGLLSMTAAGFLSTGRSLPRLPPDRRAAVLRRVAALSPESGAALEGLKAIVLLANGADQYAPELLTRAAEHDPARPDAALTVTPSTEISSVVTADVVVIGSGAGGAMAARTLARAGLATVVLEEGRRWSVDEFRNGHPIDRYAGLYRGGGATVALGRPPVVLPIGRAVGGSTVVNSGTCYRPPPTVQQRWHDEFGLAVADPARLTGYLDDVEQTLQVNPVPLPIMGRNGRLLLDGAAALGWQAAPIPRNAPGCDGCCQCALGCPINAKYGVHLNALPQACAAGARIVSHARAERVLHSRGRARGVRARRPDGTAFDVLADTVVVAAGATETPQLLWRSGLGDHPQLGRNLALHPAIALAGYFTDNVYAWRGVLQSAAVDELHQRDGVLIEATSTPPGMGSMILPGHGRELLGWLDRAPQLATFGAMVADSGAGRVIRAGRGQTLRYNLTRADAARLMVAIEAMGRLLFAAGAVEVLTGLPTGSTVTSLAALRDVLSRTNPRRLHLAAFHPTGTAAAGTDEQRCPVDATGQLRGTEGVWVADASILPSCPKVNPQLSIMALALAVADRVIEARRSGIPQTRMQNVASGDDGLNAPTPKAPVVLEARKLNKSFGSGTTTTPVLTNIDMQISRGEFVALVGPSGSGKSTLLSILGLLDTPTSGDVLINGQGVAQLSRRQLAAVRCQTIGYVFQSFNLLAGLSVVENVMLPGLLAGESGRDRYDHAITLLEQVGLAALAKRVPAELSGGEQQRVAVARALFMTPDVILADEPTGNLDTANGRKVIDALYGLNSSGQTIVLVTHDRSVADDAPRRISLLDGQIETDSGPVEPPSNLTWLAEQ